MFRVRSLLAMQWIRKPVPTCCGLARRSNSAEVLRLLGEGRKAEALEAYTAPLLSQSGVLAVQLLRDQLELTVGTAVRSRGAATLLVRWPSTDRGH